MNVYCVARSYPTVNYVKAEKNAKIVKQGIFWMVTNNVNIVNN